MQDKIRKVRRTLSVYFQRKRNFEFQTREAQKQARIDKEQAKVAAEKEAKEAKEAAEIAKKEQEAEKKADILSGNLFFTFYKFSLKIHFLEKRSFWYLPSKSIILDQKRDSLSKQNRGFELF